MIIEAIKQARKQANMTQIEAAKLINVSRKRYSELEAGKMTVKQALILLNHLNKAVLIVEMYQIKGQISELPPTKQDIIKEPNSVPSWKDRIATKQA